MIIRKNHISSGRVPSEKGYKYYVDNLMQPKDMTGEDMCDDMILDALWELKKVGVHFIAIGHVKFRDVTDAINGDTYSQLTTDMSMRSFNKLKTKLHFLGVASINREISKEKLVVVISHDMNNAKEYADRIIELSDGQVTSDKIRNQDFKEQEGDTLVISPKSNLSEESLKKVNELLNKNGLLVFNGDERFIDNTQEITSNEHKANFDGRNRSWKNTLKLAWNFIKTSKASLIVAVLVSTIIVGLLSLAHGFSTYDGSTAINEVVSRYDSKNIIYNKGYSFTDNTKDLNKNFTIEVTDNDIQAFKNTSYEGNIYPIYSIPILH